MSEEPAKTDGQTASLAFGPEQPPISQPAHLPEMSADNLVLDEVPLTSPAPIQAEITNAEPVVQPAVTTAYTFPEIKPQSKKSKWFIPLVLCVAVAVLASAGAYAYVGVYMQTPENLWKTALKKTGKSLDYFVNQPRAGKKGATYSGSYKVTAPVVSDGTLEASTDGSTTKLLANAGALGVRGNLEVRGITVSGANHPDLYVKINGLKAIAAMLGNSYGNIGPTITRLEDKWYVIDHTLIDSAADKVGSSITSETPEQIQKDVKDISRKVSTVLNDRLFTTDESRAVVKITEKLAKEDYKGRKSQHLKVKVNKGNFRAMVVALKDALKDSKAQEWLLMGQTNTSFEKALNFDNLLKQIDAANYDKATADVWVDTGLQYIRNVRITNVDPVAKSTTQIDFMLDYTGGDTFPLSVSVTKKGANTDAVVSFGIKVSKKTDNVMLSVDANGTFEKQKISATSQLTVLSSDAKVTTEKPAGATNIMDLIGTYLKQSQAEVNSQNKLQVRTGINPTLRSIADDVQSR